MNDDGTMHEGTMYDDILRDMAREAIEAGKVPRRSPDRVMGGRGAGTQCVVCGVPVERSELGFVIEFMNGSDPHSHPVHIRCYSALELQLEGLGHSNGTLSNG